MTKFMLFAASLMGIAACTKTAMPAKSPPATPSDLVADDAKAADIVLTEAQLARHKVNLGHPEMRRVTARIITSGKVAFDDDRVSHIFSPVTGRVEKILAPVGTTVTHGSALASISSPDLASAFSDTLKAKTDLEAAKHDFSRQKELFGLHAAAARDLEQAQNSYERAKAEMDRATLKSKMLQVGESDVVSQSYLLRAPLSGEVLMRNVNPGVEVQGMYSGANVANELFTVGDLSSVWVLADIYETDLARVAVGERVLIHSVAYGDELFVGSIAWIANVIDPQTRTAKIRCAIDNATKKLKPEMFVSAEILTDERQVLAVPRNAVVRPVDQPLVFVATGAAGEHSEMHFRPQVVTLGKEDGGYVSLEGNDLSESATIVTDGAILLSTFK